MGEGNSKMITYSDIDTKEKLEDLFKKLKLDDNKGISR
jgi:hypothetical protein